MTPDYIGDSLYHVLIGIPVGTLLGYAFARAEDFYRSHYGRRHRR